MKVSELKKALNDYADDLEVCREQIDDNVCDICEFNDKIEIKKVIEYRIKFIVKNPKNSLYNKAVLSDVTYSCYEDEIEERLKFHKEDYGEEAIIDVLNTCNCVILFRGY